MLTKADLKLNESVRRAAGQRSTEQAFDDLIAEIQDPEKLRKQVCADLLEENPNLTPEQLENLFLASTENL